MNDKKRHLKYIEDLKKLNDEAGVQVIDSSKQIFNKLAKMSRDNPLIFLELMKKHGDAVIPSMVKDMKSRYKESMKIGREYGLDKMQK